MYSTQGDIILYLHKSQRQNINSLIYLECKEKSNFTTTSFIIDEISSDTCG